MEAKGKEKNYSLKNPKLLSELEIISRTEESVASNAIEGVFSSVDLHSLIEGEIQPTSKSSQFLKNYYQTLLKIKNNSQIEVSTETIKMLHHLLFKNFKDEQGGKFKDRDVFITETGSKGTKVRFKSVAPELTPKYIKNLCISYEEYIGDTKVPELIVISSFIFDFLCIHPFLDGNGRVSRLLTHLLLQQNDFQVVNFISLDKIINKHSESYYKALHVSTQGWNEQKHDMSHWHIFFLSVLREAYVELFDRIENSDSRSSKTEIVKSIALSKKGEFTLAELERELPTVSNAMIRKVLIQLKENYEITSHGKGRGARWKVIL